MNIDALFVDAALRNWTSTVNRASGFFEGLTADELQVEVAPGKNRLIYLWGHLTAVHDLMLPLLGFGGRLHPELEPIFVRTPDRTAPDTFLRDSLKKSWTEVNQALESGFRGLTPSQWLERHQSVSAEDFAREPHRNRFAILLGRSSHLSYHLGQAMLTIRK